MNYLAQLKIPGYSPIALPTGFNTARFSQDGKTITLGGIVSSFLPYILGIAGLVLLLFLIMGGFQYLTSGGDPKATQSAQAKMTSAVVGFILLFVAYWLFQIIGILLGINFFQPI